MAKEVKNEQKEEYVDAVDLLLDENNTDNVILYDENDKPSEFEQIAIIPLDNSVYAILKPTFEVEGMADDEVLIFEIVEDENGNMLSIVTEEKVLNAVMQNYYELLKEEDENVEKEDKKNK